MDRIPHRRRLLAGQLPDLTVRQLRTEKVDPVRTPPVRIVRRTVAETATKVHSLGGLYIAAHVDRANHSVLGTLGAIPEPMVESEAQPGGGRFFDAVELSRTAEEALWLPKVEGYAVTRSSDAHNIDDVARVWTEADCEFSVAGLKAAFAAKATRLSPRLTSF